MQIFIARNNERHGPYSLDDIQAYLASGHLNDNDLAWHQGIQDWIPVNQIPGIKLPQNRTPPPPPQITPTKQNTSFAKKPVPAFQKAVLGTFAVMLIGGAILSSFEKPEEQKAPPATISPRPLAKITQKPIPTPTESPRQKRRRLTEERNRAREKQNKQAAYNKRQREEAYRAANPLELVDDSLDFQEEEFSSYVTGSIRNNTDHTYNYVQVTIGLYDSDGNQVGSTLANVNGLEPDKIWRFKAVALEDNAARCKILGIDGS